MSSLALESLFNFKNKVVLITGGTKGLGRAMAKAYLELGAFVATVSRDLSCGLDQDPSLANEKRIFTIGADLSDRESRSDIIRKVVDHYGGIDILINNAGHQRISPILEYTPEFWDYDLSVLLTAPFELARQAAVFMKESRGGRIINIASISSFQSARNISGYAACKHAIVGLTKSMANEWAQWGINVNAIAPGVFETSMTREICDSPERLSVIENRTPSGRIGQPNDLIGSVLFLSSNASCHVNGHVLVVDGGWLGR